MDHDLELLRRYAERGDQDAFAEVVRRHLDWVHSAALRQVNGDAHFAADVAQAVFTDLARKARTVSALPMLGGWLFTSTRFAAAKTVRTEQRRRARETEAQLMQELERDQDSVLDWTRVRAVLDSALADLKPDDRDAIVLRFFEGRDFAEVGNALGLTANAARMRVERALEKLHAALETRGVTSTAAALATALAAQSVAAAPAGLAASVTGAALAGGGAAAAGWTAFFMGATKTQIGIAAALTVAGGWGFVQQAQQHEQLRAQIDAGVVTAPSVEVLAEITRLRDEQARLEALRLEAERERELQQTRSNRLAALRVAREKVAAVTKARAEAPLPMDLLDRQPRPLKQPRPAYPPELRAAGVTGTVWVDFVVDAAGTVQNAYVLKSTEARFDAAAVEAISQWEFRPGGKSGRSVQTHVQVPIVFSIAQGAKPGGMVIHDRPAPPPPYWF